MKPSDDTKKIKKNKALNPKKQIFTTTAVIILLVALDQIIKRLIYHNAIFVNLGILNIHVITNSGASFGMLQGYNLVLLGLSIVVLILIILNYHFMPKLPFVLLVSGIIGNSVDRALLGHVIDFIDFKFFPVFNLADSCITLGIIIWIIILIREEYQIRKGTTTAGKEKIRPK
jgi:signal peptidase II